MAAADTIQVFNIKGRWGSNAPFACPPDQVLEALNVDPFRSTLGRKRSGASNISLAGGTALTGVVSFVFSHVPDGDETARELWSVDDAATPRFKRLAAGVAWADVTLTDNVSTKTVDMNAASFDGKLYFAYDSAVNRLHCWDPDSAKIRRVGLARPAAATVANTGGGAYAATLRYYKVSYVLYDAAVTRIKALSNLSASVSFTPSGAGASARITKPASISEDETSWAIWISPDDANYVLLTVQPVGTTTYDDTSAPATFTGTTATGFSIVTAPDSNAFTPPPSAKYLAVDDRYLIMANAWETTAGTSMTPSTRRAWWTSALGATDQGDSERISNTASIKSYTDFSEAITGLSVPQQGSVMIFGYNSQSNLVNTGVAAAPYVQFRVTGGKGCIQHKTIISAEDENGQPATYWISPQGPCRRGVSGQLTMVEDINDIWDLVNLEASSAVAHGVFHKDKHQIWWWLATSGSNDPNLKIVFDTRLGRVVEAGVMRKGWYRHDGLSAAARCSCLMSNTLGASMSRDLKPYIGRSTGTAIWKCDTGTTDAGTTFQSYITSRPFTPEGLGNKSGDVKDATLVAGASTGVNISVTAIRDMGAETLPANVASLTAAGTETKIFATIPVMVQDAASVQFQIGDSVAVDASWNLDAFSIPTTAMGEN